MKILLIENEQSLADKLTGLGIGADDYLTKPFHLAELNARIKLLTHRKQHTKKGTQTSSSMGLGLSIAKKICDINGFLITFEAVKNIHRISIRF